MPDSKGYKERPCLEKMKKQKEKKNKQTKKKRFLRCIDISNEIVNCEFAKVLFSKEFS